MAEMHEWWQSGIIYQVYPRSFLDENGDGVGDLKGIQKKLDYLQWLGVDCVWLSPIYPSPMADFGYDVSNYVDIHPLFGTLADFDALLADVHKRGMKLLLDFVPNHTSDEHPWFVEAKKDKTNPKRDWYIWRDGKAGGGPPNNWLSNFGGSAWTFDETTNQYYFHAFLQKQPDLNWRNPQLRAAMYDVLRFWLNRGVDGFRIDVIYHIVKDDQFRDNPRNPNYQPGQNPTHEFLATYIADRPEVHDIIAEMRKVVDAYSDRMLVGEVYLPVDRLVTYYGHAGGNGGDGVHMPFNFQLVTLDWNAKTIATAIRNYEAALPSYGWPNWVLGNHDNSRVASRAGTDQARVAGMLLLTLRGTPTLYYGDEIGMTNVPIKPEQVQDPFEKQVPGMGLGRDPERTPMQWNSSPNAGFTTGNSWLPLAADASTVNVESERTDRQSLLNLYNQMIALRRRWPALNIGTYREIYSDDKVLIFTRNEQSQTVLVCLNFVGTPQTILNTVKFATDLGSPTIRLSTLLDRTGERISNQLTLRPHEGFIAVCS